MHKALRSLPLSSDPQSSVWLSLDGHWIGFFEGDDAETGATVFEQPDLRKTLRRSGPTPPALPRDWEFLGYGWNGFTVLMNRLESRPHEKPQETDVTTRSEKWKDARAILF